MKSVASPFVVAGLAGLLIAGPTLSAGASSANALQVGVIGLFKVGDLTKYEAALTEFEGQIKIRGCGIVRSGKIFDKQSDVDLLKTRTFTDSPDRFVFLKCDKSLLGDARSRAVFRGLEAGAERVAVFEGEVMIFPTDPGASVASTSVASTSVASTSVVRDRSYILKVSIFNNEDPDRRDRDLAELVKATATRPDRYRTEAVVMVSRAIGMPTPDEVAVIYYDSPGAGERFRINNIDIMDKVAAINDRHLISYVYYVGMSTR